MPVHALFGGPVRTTLPIYWSHCGNCRVVSGPGKKARPTNLHPGEGEFSNGRAMRCHAADSDIQALLRTDGPPPIHDLVGVRTLGKEVKDRGLMALKCNVMQFGYAESKHRSQRPGRGGSGFGRDRAGPQKNAPDGLVKRIVAQLEALREGAGEEVGLKLDVNFNYKTEGYVRTAPCPCSCLRC